MTAGSTNSTSRTIGRTAFVLVVLGFAGGSGAQTSAPPAATGAMRNVSGTDAGSPGVQRQVSAAFGQDETAYHANVHRTGITLTNSRQRVSADLVTSEVAFHVGDHRWNLAFSGYGYGAAYSTARAVRPSADRNRVEYRRGPLTEWYVNGPLGIEHGLTLDAAPSPSTREPLTFVYTVSGDLAATVDPGAHGLTLVHDGLPVLRYVRLTAFDSQGRELRTWLEVARDQLRLQVDDHDATYPITVDPIAQAVKLTSALPASQCLAGTTCDDGEAGDDFGFSVAMSSDNSIAVVGVPQKLVNGLRAGAAYVFIRPSTRFGTRTTSSWTIVPIGGVTYSAKLIPSDPQTWLSFGTSVAISADNNTIVVGAPAAPDENGGAFPGAAYVYAKPGTSWSSSSPLTQTAKLTAATASVNSLGTSVAISSNGGVIIAGAPTTTVEDQANEGAAFVFQRSGIAWTTGHETTYVSGFPLHPGAMFGSSVSVSADGLTLVGGAPGSLSGTTGIGTAQVWTPCPGNTAWNIQCSESPVLLTPSDGHAGQNFGSGVSMTADATTIAVGACDCADSGAGAAYIFTKPATGWPNTATATETAKLTASDGQLFDDFGWKVSLNTNGTIMLVGAPHATVGGKSSQGAAYVFAEGGNGWTTSNEVAKVAASDGAANDSFGTGVAIDGSGTVMILGAPLATITSNNQPRSGEGAAYVFTGTASFPTATLSPTSLNFGPQSLGTTSSAQTVTLTNTGSAPLHVSSVTTTGPFASTSNCFSASPIAAGGSCTENVTFAPTAVGSATGTLTFTDDSGNAAGSTQQVALKGSGKKASTTTTMTSASPNPAIAGQQVTFGYTVTPEPGDTLTPSGTVTVSAATGESCTGPAPSGSCTIAFANAATRTVAATYAGDSNFASSTSASVTEQIVDFSLAASPSSQNISGKKATFTVTISALNGFSGSVSLACSGGPAGSTCTMSPAAVDPAGSTAGATATIALPKGAIAAGTYIVNFTGTFGGVTRSTTATLVK